MLIFPGIPPTTGGEGKSTPNYSVCMLHCHGVKGNIICTVFILSVSKTVLLSSYWVWVNSYCTSLLKQRSKFTYVYRARTCLCHMF